MSSESEAQTQWFDKLTTPSEVEGQRMQWWMEARFGMFVHWGLYSIPARGEWVRYEEFIPPEEYRPLADQFNPGHYDADAWVALAQEAGMRYMVLTTRHHDGFCLFDSQVSDFTAPKTAARRDLVGEYVEACRRAGMPIGFYYSLLDWNHPGCGYVSLPGHEPLPPTGLHNWSRPGCGPGPGTPEWEEFVGYVHAQVRELCTHYGKIDILWYDGGWPASAEEWRSAELNAMVRQLQPEIIINNRSLLPEDFDTPENQITPSEPGRPWETCMTMSDTWGYSPSDHNWKPVGQLIQDLVRCVSGGGNYLLNVGPTPEGTIPAPSVERLRAVGSWMKRNSEAIYGNGPAPLRSSMVGFTTRNGNLVYLHVFRWPGPEVVLVEVHGQIRSARLLATGRTAAVQREGRRAFIRGLPQEPPDPYDSVLVIDYEPE